MTTAARLNAFALIPEAYRAMAAVGPAVEPVLGSMLIELVNTRVSQINACAYCVDMHVRTLLEGGEDLQRINSLVTWHEVDLYTPRERAALQWAESLTLLTATHAPDADFEALKVHFNDKEIAALTFSIAQMNAWNRLGVGLRLPVAKKPLKVLAAA